MQQESQTESSAGGGMSGHGSEQPELRMAAEQRIHGLRRRHLFAISFPPQLPPPLFCNSFLHLIFSAMPPFLHDATSPHAVALRAPRPPHRPAACCKPGRRPALLVPLGVLPCWATPSLPRCRTRREPLCSPAASWVACAAVLWLRGCERHVSLCGWCGNSRRLSCPLAAGMPALCAELLVV